MGQVVLVLLEHLSHHFPDFGKGLIRDKAYQGRLIRDRFIVFDGLYAYGVRDRTLTEA